MKQTPLFADLDVDAGRAVLVVPGQRSTLSKAQTRFNTLTRQIAEQRSELQAWNNFLPAYQQRLADEFEPLHRRLRDGRIAMADLLNQALGQRALGKVQRAKMRALLLDLLHTLLDEADDEALRRLYDTHADVSYADGCQADMNAAQEMADMLFGIKLDAIDEPLTHDEWLRRVTEQIADDEPAHATARKPRKKSARTLAAEAAREQVVKDDVQALREVFRKLARDLHPDREPDPAARARKTALMQLANQAYAARDLLGLLELQLQIEQIDATGLGEIAEERLTRYNRLLEAQLQRLRSELGELVTPFVMMLGGLIPTKSGPDKVRRAMNKELRELREEVRAIEIDLVRYRDIDVLKRDLHDYRIGADDVDPIADLHSLLQQVAPVSTRRRRTRR